MPWVKGQSGNPGGRPKAADELRRALCALAPEAAKRIAELMRSEDETIAFKATECVIKHVKGLPKQEVLIETDAPEGSLAEDISRLKELRERYPELTADNAEDA